MALLDCQGEADGADGLAVGLDPIAQEQKGAPVAPLGCGGEAFAKAAIVSVDEQLFAGFCVLNRQQPPNLLLH